MRNLITTFSFCMCYVLCVSTVHAQDEPTAKKYENPQWKNVVMVDYKPGKMGRAVEIIQQYFVKASEKAGTPGPEMILNLESGEWDRMFVWHMKGGIEDMNWDMSPDGAKWTKAMWEIAGGKEKAEAIWSEYSDCVARSTSYIGRVPN